MTAHSGERSQPPCFEPTALLVRFRPARTLRAPCAPLAAAPPRRDPPRYEAFARLPPRKRLFQPGVETQVATVPGGGARRRNSPPAGLTETHRSRHAACYRHPAQERQPPGHPPGRKPVLHPAGIRATNGAGAGRRTMRPAPWPRRRCGVSGGGPGGWGGGSGPRLCRFLEPPATRLRGEQSAPADSIRAGGPDEGSVRGVGVGERRCRRALALGQESGVPCADELSGL